MLWKHKFGEPNLDYPKYILSTSNPFVAQFHFISRPLIPMRFLFIPSRINSFFTWTSILDIWRILSAQYLFESCHYRNCLFSSWWRCYISATVGDSDSFCRDWENWQRVSVLLRSLAQRALRGCWCWDHSCGRLERICLSMKHRWWQSQEILKKTKIPDDFF